MNYKKRRKEIIKNEFSVPGLIIMITFACTGLAILYFSGIFNIENKEMLYDCFSNNGLIIIIGTFLIVISLVCWAAFVRNIIFKPKNEILYLHENKEDRSVFLNKKGKKFEYKGCNKEENKYYYVMKTADYIYDVLEECDKPISNFSSKEKKSYWLNFYSPIGNFEDILLLPIVYVIMLPGLLSFLMAKGSDKIYGIIWCALPLYAIIYDLIYKVKLSRSDNGIVNDLKMIDYFNYFIKFICILIASFPCFLLLNLLLKLSDLKSILIFFPFVGLGFCSSGLALANIFKNKKLVSVFKKGFIVVLLLSVLGYVIIFT